MRKAITLLLIFLIVGCVENKTEIQSKSNKIVKQKNQPQENKLKLTGIEKKVADVALSFHKWYIKNTNYEINKEKNSNFHREATSFKVVKGDNGKCLLDYEPYFSALKRLGSISEKFMQKEKQRTSKCAKYMETIDWIEYDNADGYVYDKFCDCMYYLYWTRSQEDTENLNIVSISKLDRYWNVLISIDGRKVNVKVENEKGKYLLTEIVWDEEE